jgi:hypothetical protein
MSRLTNKKCPLYKEDCCLEGCSFYSPKLDNCAVNLLFINLYGLDKALTASALEKNQPEQPAIPYPLKK